MPRSHSFVKEDTKPNALLKIGENSITSARLIAGNSNLSHIIISKLLKVNKLHPNIRHKSYMKMILSAGLNLVRKSWETLTFMNYCKSFYCFLMIPSPSFINMWIIRMVDITVWAPAFYEIGWLNQHYFRLTWSEIFIGNFYRQSFLIIYQQIYFRIQLIQIYRILLNSFNRMEHHHLLEFL